MVLTPAGSLQTHDVNASKAKMNVGTLVLTTTNTLANALLDVSESQLDNREYLAASSTLWRAGVAALEAVADARGWEVDPHRSCYDVEEKLKHEIDSDILVRGMGSISTTRQNSLDDYRLDESWLRGCAEDIRAMVEAIEAVTYID